MSDERAYPIGTPGKPWGEAERAQWLAQQRVQRSYADAVLRVLDSLASRFDVEQYGGLPIDPDRYPLMAARSTAWRDGRPVLLVTGGVHGYETSGVLGALRFLDQQAEHYAQWFNVLVAPCVSPWGFETINRWNPEAVDPNRSFIDPSPAEESRALQTLVRPLMPQVKVHIDLHETTDTDNTEFRPALASRDARHQAVWDIPDGFYTVGDSARPVPDFQRAVIESVQSVTHIAPSDANGQIIGKDVQQPGVILYDAGPLGLCMGVSDAEYVTTTEVYPDSPRVSAEQCIQAQVAAVTGGVEHVLAKESA